MNKDIVLLDLFSGIGGFHAGLTRAGFNITKSYTSEIDKHAIAIYKYHFKNSEYVGDVTALDGRSITRPNIITFGSPCQDFSVAGKRAGLEGQRSSLIGQAIRLITECKPDFFIWENVKGVFSSNNGEDFWAVIQAFADIGGYRLEWQLLNTAWFLPQNRERIYLVGHLAKDGRDWQGIFPIRESNRKDVAVSGQSINALTARYEGLGNGSYIAEGSVNAQEKILKGGVKNKFRENTDGTATCLSARDYKGYNNQDMDFVLVEPTHKHGDDRVYEDIAPTIQSRYGTGGDNVPYVVSHYGHKDKEPTESDIVPTLKAESHGHTPMIVAQRGRENGQQLEPSQGDYTNTLTGVQKDNYIAINRTDHDGNNRPQGYRTYDIDGISPTLSAQNGGVSQGSQLIQLTSSIRRLTEIECERLQGFEDNWTQYGDYDGEVKSVSRTQRYKCLGNAVTVDVVAEVGRRLLKL